jgi:hypothetical protein
MPFIDPLPVIEFVPLSDNVRTRGNLVYECYRLNHTFTVPTGFISDGASIPRILWTLVGHPFDRRWRKESVLHDWFYRTTDHGVSRKMADKIFYDSLRDGGLRRTKAWLMYLGVRAGGWVAWKKS